MRHLGNVKTKKEAIEQCHKVAKETGNTCVYEKAKCRDYPSPKRYVCYRGWLDLEDKSARVIDMNQWDKERKLGKGFRV